MKSIGKTNSKIAKSNNLNKYDSVYGKSFQTYNQDEVNLLTQNLETRFKANKINPRKLFNHKMCLDAGCGFGAGSLFLAKNGASSVNSVDISKINIKSIKQNAERFNFSKVIKTSKASVLDLPFKDESFDVVWCYGVIHHTSNPDKGLMELTRVLKCNGKLIIFLYGIGGVFWYTVYRGRKFAKKIPVDYIRKVLKLCNTNIHMEHSIIDNWKTPYLCNYSNSEVQQRIKELGLIKSEPFKFGTDWDINHRISKFRSDKKYMGGGDLRYIFTKKTHITSTKKTKYSLHDNDIKPDNKLDSFFIKQLSEYIDRFELKNKKNNTLGIIFHKQLFVKVCELQRSKREFNYEELINFIKKIS